jgi:hypothetical protein
MVLKLLILLRESYLISHLQSQYAGYDIYGLHYHVLRFNLFASFDS